MTRKVSVLVVEDGMDEFFKRAHNHARILDRGEALPGETTIIFEDPVQLLGMLTVERKRLLYTLRDEGATPITALAERLGRDKRAVSRDVSAMRERGMVKTKYVFDAGKKRNMVVMPTAKRLELKAAI
jgi:predicted transcriptional regulator